VVGQEQAKQALLMVAASPLLGGVLLRGDKGSAKTTLARGLATLLPGDAPFVELPLGATEERVVGSLDLTALLTRGEPRFHPGLLAAAHGGVLYVDEINLLADHLVDTLLDVSVSGVNRVERDGLSHVHPARFVLVASMNPEEGELRPQLLDRFGLSIDVRAPDLVAHRTVAVRRQLSAERTRPDDNHANDNHANDNHANDDHTSDDDRLRRRVIDAVHSQVEISDDVLDVASRLAVEVGAEGLRADLMLCRAAMANAALDNRSRATSDDVRAVAPMVLGHRRRRRPFDEPGITPEELDRAWQQATATATDDESGDGSSADDQHDEPDGVQPFHVPDEKRTSATARTAARTPGEYATAGGPRGRFLRAGPYDDSANGRIDGRATAVALAGRRLADRNPTSEITVGDLRTAAHEQRIGSLLVFVVDASASMGVEHRMAVTKAAVLGLLGDAYRRRGRVALITFRGDGAEIVLRPTASIEIARGRLSDLRSGGATPLAAGLDQATGIVTGSTGDQSVDCTVIVITDGRATSGGVDPMGEAYLAMERLARTGPRIVVLDTETGPTRLGLALTLAERVGATCLPLDVRNETDLEQAVRSL
jgi:magnesium chelatase subunit D